MAIFRAGQVRGSKTKRRAGCRFNQRAGVQQLIFPVPYRMSPFYAPPVYHNSQPSPEPPTPKHESALTDKNINHERAHPECTQTLDVIIAVQLGSLTDLETYVAAAAQGMHARPLNAMQTCGLTRSSLLRIREQYLARLRRPQSSTRSGRRCTRFSV